MSIVSKLKIESKGVFATSIFYVIVGIIFLALLPITGFPPHIAIIGLFSLIAAFGMFTKRSWTIWLVVILFFVANTFSAYMLYYYLSKDYLQGLGVVAYLIFTWIATAYAATKRKSLES
jgi:glucan phosphoethanolaminetransferase (alkaline phosphatase superfamily)